MELDPSFDADIYTDVLKLDPETFAREQGPFDFVWASPPCTTFSRMSMSHHWEGTREWRRPRTDAARHGVKMVEHALSIIRALDPPAWVMENPRAMLRKLPVVEGLPRVTVTYCQYGDTRMKPTDLWGKFPPTWKPRPMCKRGAPCHVAAPRGASTGTQGMRNARERGRVPYALGKELLQSLTTPNY